MNKQEQERLQLAARAVAAETLALWAADLLRLALPHEAGLRSQSISAIHKKLALMREDYQQMTFPEMAPVESDLWAAEVQEAFDDLSKRFVSAIEKSKT